VSPTDSLGRVSSSNEDRDRAGEPDEENEGVDRPTFTSGRPEAKRRRTSSAGGRSAPAPPSARSDRSTRWAIDRLEDREKRFSFAAAGGAVVFGIVVYLIESSPHFHRVKGQLSPQTLLVVGLVGGALLLGATLLGRRAPVGFVALFLGLMFSSATLFLALPFLALAIWILYHSYKIQREASAEARAARAEAKESPRSGAARSGAARSTRVSSRSGPAPPKKRRAGGPARPEANKRYTPKRPPPPAPKPSRRERKATPQASD
jgi:hypothetical protein